MDWNVLLNAAIGRADALDTITRQESDAHRAALATLLLLHDAPHPAAALVAVALVRGTRIAPLIAVTLAPHAAPALTAWRDDPQWAERAVGAATQKRLAWSIDGVVGALHAHPVAQRAAIAIALRNEDSVAVAHCLKALGADGWEALEDDVRAALLTRASAAACGWVWNALDETQRAAAAQAAVDSSAVAHLVGRIGPAAWRTTALALRERLIDAVAQRASAVDKTAPAWPGMTDDERETLAMAAIARGGAWCVRDLLDALGPAGRAVLNADQRARLETLALARAAWDVHLMRIADDGWDALSPQARRAVRSAAQRYAARTAVLLRALGGAGWRALRADERTRLVATVRRAPKTLFRCPPALWSDLAGDALPPATRIPAHVLASWRAEDADADLSRLPPAHQALVLALAPWRAEEAAKDSVRVRGLLATWDQTAADERAALATAHPSVLAPVAAAAHLAGGATAALDAVGATVARVVTATGGSAVKRDIGAMLCAPDDWRSWMIAFAPTDGDPSDVREAWRAAAQRGSIADAALCARLAASPRESGPRHPRARAGR